MLINSNPTVTILMATYNGARYVSDQIDSILSQSFKNWELIIRDDGSADNTVEIIKGYQAGWPNISLIVSETNEGSLYNFSALLEVALDKPYVMFCDQDDFWLPDKLMSSIQRLLEEEKRWNVIPPVLLYSNLTYTDRFLKPVGKEIRFTLPDARIFNKLMIQNWLWGCTMLLNSPLVQLVQNIPSEAENHDYWTALTAASFGKIIHLDRSTILYRQHQRNISGQYNDDSFLRRLNRILKNEVILKDIDKKCQQIKAFKKRHDSKLRLSTRELISKFIKCMENRSICNLPFFIKNSIYRRNFFSSALYYSYLIRKLRV